MNNENQESKPLHELKVSTAGRLIGNAFLTIISILCLVCSSCVGILLMAVFIDPQAFPQWLLICFWILFVIPIYWLSYRFASWTVRKDTRKKVLLYSDRLDFYDGISETTTLFSYDQVEGISIARGPTGVLGFEFDLVQDDEASEYLLETEIAQFPKDKTAIEETVLPAVLDKYDQIVRNEDDYIEVNSRDTPYGLRKYSFFLVCVAFTCLLNPQLWSYFTKLLAAAKDSWDRAKFCSDIFYIDDSGIYFDDTPDQVTPLSEIFLAKFDDVALVVQSKITGEAFKSPISGWNTYATGYWLKSRLQENAFDRLNDSEEQD